MKKGVKRNKAILAVVVIVLILAILGLVLKFGITGKTISSEDQTRYGIPFKGGGLCQDADGGDNPGIQGTAVISSGGTYIRKTDKCSFWGKTLTEYYCIDRANLPEAYSYLSSSWTKVLMAKTYICNTTQGSCSSGACVPIDTSQIIANVREGVLSGIDNINAWIENNCPAGSLQNVDLLKQCLRDNWQRLCSTATPGSCTPATCGSRVCGTISNGTCAGTINCGSCASGSSCNYSTGQCAIATNSMIYSGTFDNYNFNGSTYVDLPSSSDYISPDAFTMTAWARPLSRNAEAIIISKDVTAYKMGWMPTRGSPTGVFVCTFGYEMEPQSTRFSQDVWNFVACVFNGTTGKVYVNGTLRGSSYAPRTLSNGGSNVTIGDYSNHNLAHTFNGSIHEVRLYNSALNESQVRDIMLVNPPQ